MKIYEYACHEKLCGQNWLNREAPAVHFKGGIASGWTTKGGGELQGSSDQMNKAMQEGCNSRMDKGYQAYAKYTPTDKELQTYVTKKLSREESQKKIEGSRKAAAQIYDKAGLDPYKQAKKKPQ